MPLEEFNRLLAEQLRVPVIDWKEYYLKSVDPVEEMAELLAWAAEHYHIGLLSNIMPGFIDEMLARKLLPDVPYSTIVDSSEVAAIKPEEQIYQIAQGLSGVSANEILLVDDSRTNLMAAEKLGWHVLWFDDYRPEDATARIRSALQFST